MNLQSIQKSCFLIIIISIILFLLAWNYDYIICFWKWFQNDEESNSSLVRNIFLICASIIGLPIAVWRSYTAQKQVNISQKQINISQKSLSNERYQKGAEMLGHEKLAVRLGGIHTLSYLARDFHKDYHIPVMSLLCNFIRDSKETKRPLLSDENYTNFREDWYSGDIDYEPENTDICFNEVMLFIQERNEAQCTLERNLGYMIDLSNCDLCGANLSSSTFVKVNFRDADLGGANFSKSNLQNVNFSQAKLLSANFSRANLKDVNLENTNLKHTDFKDAIIEGEISSVAKLGGAKYNRNTKFPHGFDPKKYKMKLEDSR